MSDTLNFEKVTKTIAKVGTFILLLNFGGKILAYLFHKVLTEVFAQEIYGIFALSWAFVTVATAVLFLRIPNAVTRYIAFYRGKNDKEGVKSTVTTGSVMIVLLCLFSLIVFFILFTFFPELILRYFSLTKGEFILVCALFLIHVLIEFYNQVIAGFRRPEIAAGIRFLRQVFDLVAIVALVLIGITIFRTFFALFLSVFLSGIISCLYASKKYDIYGTFKRKLVKKLLNFGIATTAVLAANRILGWADIFMMRGFKLDFAYIGIYNIANVVSSFQIIFFASFNSIFSPIITEFFGKKDIKGVSETSSYVFESFFLLSLPIFLAFVTFPREILVILFSSDYGAGAVVFQILSLSMFLYGLTRIFSKILHASGNPQKVAKVAWFAAILNVIANFFLIPRLGIEGAAISTLVSSAIILIFSYLYVHQMIELRIEWSRIVKILLSAFLTIPAISLAKGLIENSLLSLIFSGIILVFVYLILLIILKTFRKQDVVIVKAACRKFKLPEKLGNFLVGIVERGVGY